MAEELSLTFLKRLFDEILPELYQASPLRARVDNDDS